MQFCFSLLELHFIYILNIYYGIEHVFLSPSSSWWTHETHRHAERYLCFISCRIRARTQTSPFFKGLNPILKEKYWCIRPPETSFMKSSFYGVPWDVLQLCICLAFHGLLCFWAHLWHLEACLAPFIYLFTALLRHVRPSISTAGAVTKLGWWMVFKKREILKGFILFF